MEEEGAIVVQPTGRSSRPENRKRKTEIGSSVVPSRPSPYDVLIRMPILEDKDDYTQRLYTLKIHADAVDGDKGSISEVFSACTPHDTSTFALLGSDLYCLGGRAFNRDGLPPSSSDVFKLKMSDPTDHWIPVRSMISSRLNLHPLVLGGKLYVLAGGHYSPSPSSVPDYAGGSEVFDPLTADFAGGGEVYDPMTDSWQALPDPPCYLGVYAISAALENPSRILVASIPVDEDYNGPLCANFFMYDVQKSSWKTLDPVRRKLHRKCPLAFPAKAVAVRNFLYWITEDLHLLAYNIDSDLWLKGNLRGRNIEFLEYNQPGCAGFLHLENERFCVLQHSFDRYPTPQDHHVHCLVFDVSHLPEKNKLLISIVSTGKYNTKCPTAIADVFLMGK